MECRPPKNEMYHMDYHMHSLCSSDSRAPLTAMAAAAAAAGLKEICITDHWNFLDQAGELQPREYNWAPSLAQLKEARKAFQGKVEIRLGLEVGNAMVSPVDADRGLLQPKLDFVIGSLHSASVAAGGVGYASLPYRAAADCYRALDDYFGLMTELVELDSYDILGHIIYPLRYFPEQFGITLERHFDVLERILRRAVERGKGIEVNTTCGKTLEEWKPVLALYRACGGEILTFGADAHAPAHVGAGLREARAMALTAGFRYAAGYRGRAPKLHRL